MVCEMTSRRIISQAYIIESPVIGPHPAHKRYANKLKRCTLLLGYLQ